MADKPIGYYVDKMLLGLRLRCPNCGKGKVFASLFKMEKMCPYCGVQYERLSGESTGGMYINLGVAEALSVGGFFIFQVLLNPPLIPHVIFWVIFNLLFVVLFYRHSRAMWVSINYLTNHVYADPDFQSTIKE